MTAPIAYKFNRETGAFAGAVEKAQDPLETKVRGEPVYVGLSNRETYVAPPEFAEHQIPVWNGTSWDVVPNFIGQTYYTANGDEVVVKSLGNPSEFDPPLNKDKPAPQLKSDDVNEERDRRLAAGFNYNGKEYQSDDRSCSAIAEFGALATKAIQNGTEANDLRWHGGDQDFAWIAADNSRVPMDAPMMQELAAAALRHKNAIVMAAARIKMASPIPADYKEDQHWQ